MPLWLFIAGCCATGLAGLTVMAFAWTAAQEREWRALGVTLVVGIPVATLPVLPLLVDFPGRFWVLAGVLGIGTFVSLLVLLPLGAGRPVQIVGEQPQVDERDAFFHRFYRLEPGMPEYDEYYADRPEERAFDERVRALPGLAAPDSAGYHPETAPFARATFDVIEELARDLDRAPEPLGDAPVSIPPERLSRRLKGFAHHHGAALVGCTTLNPAYVYSHNARGPGPWGEPIDLSAHSHAIAIATEMDPALIRLAPASATLAESAKHYLETTRMAVLLARYLQRLGHQARAHVDANYRVMAVPIAVDAGLGELGRIGLLMTPEYGPRVRLAVVTTDAPLAQDKPRTFGAAAFCERCKKCAENCPANAIDSGERREQRGAEKWLSRQDTCFRYWRTVGSDCALCIKVCPYAHPKTPMHDLVRWGIRRGELARWVALKADDLAYGRRPSASFSPPDWHDPEAP